MSRTLPDRPSLDHLKKQAKSLLDDLRATQPDAQLADALHALARDYGFASWPKLKAHVEAVSGVLPAREHPLSGVWDADVGSTATEIRSATIEFAVAGDTVSITDHVIDAAGNVIDSRAVDRTATFAFSSGPPLIEPLVSRSTIRSRAT